MNVLAAAPPPTRSTAHDDLPPARREQPHASAERVDRRYLYTRLQHDWVRLCASAPCLEQALAWRLPVGRIGSLDDLLRLAGYGRVGACTPQHDEVLSALVGLARVDDLAARVVLQRILPGLWSMVRRRGTIATDDPATVREQDDEVLSTAWTVIRCFRLDHRQDHLAARMLKEIEYRVFRLPHRRFATFVPTTTDHLDRPVDHDPLGDPATLLELLLLDARRRGLPDDDVLMLRHWGAGTPAADLAAAQSVTDRTIRNHRWTALRRLRMLVASGAVDTEVGDAAQGVSRMMSSVSQAR